VQLHWVLQIGVHAGEALHVELEAVDQVVVDDLHPVLGVIQLHAHCLLQQVGSDVDGLDLAGDLGVPLVQLLLHGRIEVLHYLGVLILAEGLQLLFVFQVLQLLFEVVVQVLQVGGHLVTFGLLITFQVQTFLERAHLRGDVGCTQFLGRLVVHLLEVHNYLGDVLVKVVLILAVHSQTHRLKVGQEVIQLLDHVLSDLRVAEAVVAEGKHVQLGQLLQSFQLGNVVVGQTEVREAGEGGEILDETDVVEGQVQPLELGEFVEGSGFDELYDVRVEFEFTQVSQALQVLDLHDVAEGQVERDDLADEAVVHDALFLLGVDFQVDFLVWFIFLAYGVKY